MTSADTAVRTLSEEDTEDIKALLLGHRIVKAEEGSFKISPKPRYYYGDGYAPGRLTLDDGTQILVIPNEGCGGCSSGWYSLESLASVDNVITSVDVVDNGGEDYEDRSYRIYVYAEAEKINVLQVDGNDGNGYYGTGYELIVIPGTTS